MLRIGLIGAGRTVQAAHAPALQALHDDYRVAAIADAAPEALATIGVLLGVPPERRYRSYHDMLLAEPLDVVDISLPHAFHVPAAIDALHAGCHVIVERPLALTAREGEEVLHVAEARGKLLSVLHYFLYYPPFREGLQLVRAGAIGRPFFIRCEGVTGGFGPGTDSYHPDWHNQPALAGGGVWMDSGYHAVYLCMAGMMSPVLAVAANIGTFGTALSVDDTAAALLTHENDGLSSIQAAWSVPAGGQRVFEIHGTDGTIAFDHDGHPLGLFRNGPQSWEHPHIDIVRDASYLGIFRAIADCLQHGAPPPVSHLDALATLRVVEAGYRAGAGGSVAQAA